MSKIQAKIKEIAEIAASVPENLQVKCFEILLRDFLSQGIDTETKALKTASNKTQDEIAPAAAADTTDDTSKETAQVDISQADLHVKVKRFIEKYSITIAQLNNLFYKEGEEILPLYEDLKATKMSEAQIRIALLQALNNALKTGDFVAQIEDIRTECRDRKALDQGNFSANFRNNSTYFDFETYDKETKNVRLSEAGRKVLADIIPIMQ